MHHVLTEGIVLGFFVFWMNLFQFIICVCVCVCEYIMEKLFHVHKYFTENQCVRPAVYRNQPNTEYLSNIKVSGLAL
jgi:hypothetical protein